MEIATIGLDIAKRVFQAHGADCTRKTVLRRKLQRGEVLAFFKSLAPCLVGIEARATGHHWARTIGALGHEVRLPPPAYVKPYVKRGKTEAADKTRLPEVYDAVSSFLLDCGARPPQDAPRETSATLLLFAITPC